MGLAYIAANLEKYDYPVEILDCPALGITIEEIPEKVKDGNYDIVGFTMLTPMFSKVKRSAKAIKEILPNIKIITGGVHATALPKRTLEEIPEIDFICIGEGEKTLLELVRAIENNSPVNEIQGIAHRNNNEIQINPARAFEQNIDNFPEPARHLLPMDKYKLTASRTSKGRFVPTLIVARGCPFNCLYCSHPFGRTFRHHSVERIIGEIETLINKFEIEEINIEADSLAVKKDFIMSLCQTMIDKGINKKIKWTCENRVDLADAELLNKMAEAGCWQISYGVESGVQRLLDFINKNETLEQFERIFKITHDAGITIRAFFMLGIPTETREESLQTIEFAKKLDPLWAQFTIATPYPGTPLFDMLNKQGKIRSYNWDYYNTWGGWTENEVPFVCEGRTLEELRALQKKALVSFYLRPRAFWKFAKRINSFSALKKYSAGLFTILKTRLQVKIK